MNFELFIFKLNLGRLALNVRLDSDRGSRFDLYALNFELLALSFGSWTPSFEVSALDV